MADYISIVTIATSAGKTFYNGTTSMVIQSNTNVDAEIQEICEAFLDDPGTVWSDSNIVTVPTNVWTGWTCTINVIDATDGTTVLHTVTDTGLVTDTSIDDMGARLETALNLLTGIDNAAYTAGTDTLVIAAGASDALGEEIVTVVMNPPSSWNDQTIAPAGMIGTITDEGLSSADLSVVFTVTSPPALWPIQVV